MVIVAEKLGKIGFDLISFSTYRTGTPYHLISNTDESHHGLRSHPPVALISRQQPTTFARRELDYYVGMSADKRISLVQTTLEAFGGTKKQQKARNWGKGRARKKSKLCPCIGLSAER